jgi:hypothetical protein
MAITKSSQSRVFIIEGRARGDHDPSYESSMRMGSPSQGFGDIERIESPDPDSYGNFIEVAEVRGATERATTSLEGRYARDLASELLRLARKRCGVDIQLHFGACQDPNDFNDFDKILMFDNASLTNWSGEDMGALQSGDESAVNETADISAEDMYEVLPVGVGEKAGSVVTNEVVDVKICDVPACGECESESDGCQKIFSVTKAAGGSPSTPSDVVFSIDKGVTWYAHDVDSLGAAEDASGIDCVGTYVVVVSNASGSLHYALKSEFDGVTDPTFAEITTGFVALSEPNAIFSIGNMAFIVGDNGYVYKTTDPTAGVTVLDAGTAAKNAHMNDVYASSTDIAVAVGNNGTVIYTINQSTWAAAPTSPVGFGTDLYTVFVKTESEWWVGGSDGNLYYTVDGGSTWVTKAFSGSGAGNVYDIEFSTDSVAWLSHATATPAGRMLRSYDGGHSWNILPEGTGTLPANDNVNAIAACMQDANFAVGVGLGDDGADGYIVVASA